MKWKAGVKILDENGIWICDGTQKKRLGGLDAMIAKWMEHGSGDDDELLTKVAAELKNGDIDAGFRLAQFVEDYGEFIAEGQKNKVFWEGTP